MAHAGTMDLGGSAARAKQNRRRWPVVVLTLVVVVATIAAVWFASSAGLVGGTSAKPAADRSYDAIEAQRGAVTLSSVQSQALTDHLNGILDRAHAAPYVGEAVTLSSDQSQALNDHLNGILDRAHAAPYVGEAVTLPLMATSGTFHAGMEGAQQIPQAKRDRVGGP